MDLRKCIILTTAAAALFLSSCSDTKTTKQYNFQTDGKTEISEERIGVYSTEDGAVSLTCEYAVENKNVSLKMTYKNNTDLDISVECGSPITISINGGSSDKVETYEPQWQKLSPHGKYEAQYDIDLSRWEESGSNKWQTYSYNAVSLGFDTGVSVKCDGKEYTYSGNRQECCFVLNGKGNEDVDLEGYKKFFEDFLVDIKYNSIVVYDEYVEISLPNNNQKGELTQFLEKWHIDRDKVEIFNDMNTRVES